MYRYKTSGKSFNKLLGIVISYLLMNSLLCHGFTKKIKYTVILLYPLRMLEYYFSKGFVILKRNSNNLLRIENDVNQIIHALDIHDSDYVMIFTAEINSI